MQRTSIIRPRTHDCAQADIESIAELYGTPDKAKDRDREKHRRDVKDLLTSRGKQGAIVINPI